MKLACLTMFRNEAAILGPFLDQLQAFCDHAVLVDHGSTDGGAAMVAARGDSRLEVLRLQSAGYPQAAVMTGLAHRILRAQAPDFLLLLDCDEFLPFASRAELEAFLEPHRGRDGVTMPWLNIVPEALEGGNIFAGGFHAAAAPSANQRKVILNGRLAARQGWGIAQGNHHLVMPAGEAADVAVQEAHCLLHLPVQSRAQFRFKLAAGARRIAGDAPLRREWLGTHWIALDRLAEENRLDEARLRACALAYPEAPEAMPASRPLSFAFPYVRAPFAETAGAIAGQLDGLLQQMRRPPAEAAHGFTVTDGAGEVVLSAGPEPAPPAGGPSPTPLALLRGTLAEEQAALVEPLFSLPAKLPPTAWLGHIPFLFALFRTVRPATYVDLGVHFGASIIAAATAARSNGLPTRLYGVDTWQGDEHAGHYQGDAIHAGLRDFLAKPFPETTLLRCLFDEARDRFAPGSVDILHIDGLHTYDAVKHDFATWFDRMAPQGVILFHDICVHDRGFGVHELWAELKRHFPTMEFHHSHGLGVLFLDPSGERFAPFRRLMADPAAMRAYRNLAALVAGTLQERMDGLVPLEEEEMVIGLRRQIADWAEMAEAQARRLADAEDALAQRTAAHLAAMEELAEERAKAAALLDSTSWRVTRPLRGALRLLGR